MQLLLLWIFVFHYYGRIIRELQQRGFEIGTLAIATQRALCIVPFGSIQLRVTPSR
jgi:hypothetical protein